MYFGKQFLGYLTGGAMNKTHILVFPYSTWFDHKIHLNIPIVILQHLDRISYSDPAATRNEPTTTGTKPTATGNDPAATEPFNL